jgi:hypothetical protein
MWPSLEYQAVAGRTMDRDRADEFESDAKPFGVPAQQTLPIDFLLRVNGGILQHGLAPDHDQATWHEKHCY